MKKLVCYFVLFLFVMSNLSAREYTDAYRNYMYKRAEYERGDIVTDYFTLEINSDEGWIPVISGQLYMVFSIKEYGGTKWNSDKKIEAEEIAFLELNDPNLPFEQLKGPGYHTFHENFCRTVNVSDDTSLYVYNMAGHYVKPSYPKSDAEYDVYQMLLAVYLNGTSGKPLYSESSVDQLIERIVVK